MAAAEAADYTTVDVRLIEQQVRAKLEDWRGLLTANVADGRMLLREVLAGPMRFTPAEGRYQFEGTANMGGILSGSACNLGGVPGGKGRHV